MVRTELSHRAVGLQGGMAMKESEARALLCELGRRMWQKGWVASNDGNLSVRLETGAVLTTPTGVSKGFLRPDDLVVVELDGTVRSGVRPPSSELGMHLCCYRLRPEVSAVVHAHPAAATAFACARRPIDCPILGETLMTLGAIPVTEYAQSGTPALPDALAPLIRDHDAVLLANHGAVTVGADPEQAYYRMETVEHTALIHLYTHLLGGGVPLTREEQDALRPHR